MRRNHHLPHRNARTKEWVLGDFSDEKVNPFLIRQHQRMPTLGNQRHRRSPIFSLAAVIAFLLHLVVLLVLWQKIHLAPVPESFSPPVTEVEIAPLLDPIPAAPLLKPSAQQELQEFQSSALARAESLERSLTQAIAQQASTEATQQQQLDALATAQTTLQGQVTALTEEKADLTARLDNERQRTVALTQQVYDIQQAREKEVQGVRETYDHLVAALQGEISQNEIALHQAKEKLTVTILDRVLFPSGQATLTPEGEQLIEKVGVILAKMAGQRILIEGHTDNVPIGATLSTRFPSNWELSSARATEVVKYLISRAQLSPQQLSAVGRAETSPVATNANEEGRKLNRRIEIIVLPLGT